MRVRFSYDTFRVQRHGGVSRYIAELHSGLLGRGVDSRIFALLHRNAYLDGRPGVIGLDVEGLRPRRARQALTKVVDRAFERLWARAQGGDTIYHKTYFDLHIPRGPRLVVTVYDMNHERFPGSVSARDVTPASKRPWCEAADLVFAISEQTRVDLLERFNLSPERVLVTPLGVRHVVPAPGALARDEPPFVLYVGDRWHEHKNFPAFARAFARSKARGEHRLVCFGGGSFSGGEQALLASLGLGPDEVVHRSGDDEVLAAYYARAAVFVYPSLYEGFGLPPLEAMTQGCPVAAARAGSIPEVVGEAALLFDPTDEDAMVAAIEELLGNAVLRSGLVAAGQVRAAGFTWDRTVSATLEGYRRIVG